MCFVDVGLAMLVIALILCGSGLIPSDVRRNPKYLVVDCPITFQWIDCKPIPLQPEENLVDLGKMIILGAK